MGTEPQSAADYPRVENTRGATAPGPLTAGRVVPANRRILIVDDNPAIHELFRRILGGACSCAAERRRAGSESDGQAEDALAAEFAVDSADNGEQALEKTRHAMEVGEPYALAFVDLRMPGWDGVETITRIWQVCPDLQVVVCTGYSDYSWEALSARLGASDNFVILKQPFDNIEALQLAWAFTRKWQLKREAQLRLDDLKAALDQRTRDLELTNQELRRAMQEHVEAERQLRQAQKMEAIGQLAAGVAHDFNNILTVVHGHASMLLMRLGDAGPHSRSVTEIRVAAERAANLVRQLLMFSRKQLMQFRNVDLGDVIRSISGMLCQLVGEHIKIETHCPPGLAPIFADRGMIEQVIVNLTVNARDAMPRGGPITISSSAVRLDAERANENPEARPGEFTCLTVSDTGCGMDAEVLSHLYEPFYTTKEIGKGTGLGLATVYGIVKQHHGWIAVQSQVSVGTTFQIYFPASNQPVARPPEPKEEAPEQSGGETILIAEDELALRELVAEVLEMRGYKVLAADSGPEALEIWKKEQGRIDLLLTDMVMPGGMMGTDLAKQLKGTNPKLKIIFTTGYSPGSSGLLGAVSEGANFLAKPYSPKKLAETIRKCLDS